MKALFDLDDAPVFAIPVRRPARAFGGPAVFEGMLVDGPQGWGEFSPPPDADPRADVRHLTAALEPGTVGWPDAVRGRIPISTTVPAAAGADEVRGIISGSSCRSVDLIVGAGALADDVARVEAAREALGPDGAIRCDARGVWTVEDAVTSVAALTKAARGLQFVAQPCASVEDVAEVRRRVDVAIAVDACRVHDLRTLVDAADIAVLHPAPLGGVRRALRVAEQTGLPCVVSTPLATGVGIASGLALAGVLPELPYACRLDRTWLDGDVASSSRAHQPVDGHLPVPPMPPGPDPGRVAEFAMADPDRVAWWRARLRAAADAT